MPVWHCHFPMQLLLLCGVAILLATGLGFPVSSRRCRVYLPSGSTLMDHRRGRSSFFLGKWHWMPVCYCTLSSAALRGWAHVAGTCRLATSRLSVQSARLPQGPRGSPGGGAAGRCLLRRCGAGPSTALFGRPRGRRAGERRAALHPPARCAPPLCTSNPLHPNPAILIHRP